MFLKSRIVFIIVLSILLIVTEIFPAHIVQKVKLKDEEQLNNPSEIFSWMKYRHISLLNNLEKTYADTITNSEEKVIISKNEEENELENVVVKDKDIYQSKEFTENTENGEKSINTNEDDEVNDEVDRTVLTDAEKNGDEINIVDDKASIEFEENENEEEIIDHEDNNEDIKTNESDESVNTEQKSTQMNLQLLEKNKPNDGNKDEENKYPINETIMIKDINELDEDVSFPITPMLLEFGLLEEFSMNSSLSYNAQGRPVITLNYVGEGTIVNLLNYMYMIFSIPEPIGALLQESNIKFSYDVPILLGLIIARNKGEFTNYQIKEIDYSSFKEYTVSAPYFDLLTLGLNSYFAFELEIELPYLPYTSSQQYSFSSQLTNDLISLHLLSQYEPIAFSVLNSNGELSFESVPATIPFQPTPIPLQAQYVKRQQNNFTIAVKDTRGKGAPWRLDVHIDAPLTLITDDSKKLVDALRFRKNANEELILSTQAQTIFSGETDVNQITELTWNENEGPLIYVNPNEVRIGEYQTEITWTLVDAP